MRSSGGKQRAASGGVSKKCSVEVGLRGGVGGLRWWARSYGSGRDVERAGEAGIRGVWRRIAEETGGEIEDEESSASERLERAYVM